LRYVLAGAEPVKETTRKIFLEKFGLRLFEGYGVAETAPVLALNTPMFNRFGRVGRLLPGVEARLEQVAGDFEGGRLHMRGPKVTLGYLKTGNPGVIEAPPEGGHDTGDIVTIDAQGFQGASEAVRQDRRRDDLACRCRSSRGGRLARRTVGRRGRPPMCARARWC
jgi:acyl-[acyl-carrier-protein]-phospholipid O-acyltransferase/long-chain-fatty-acid--[acyl-carrier-protein] ligase